MTRACPAGPYARLLGLLPGLAPIGRQPHLTEKLKMLVVGSLTRPLDALDLVHHALPMALMLARLARMARAK